MESAPFAFPADRAIDRVAAAAVLSVGIASAVVLFRVVGDWRFGAAFLAGFLAIAALVLLASRVWPQDTGAIDGQGEDVALLRAAIDAERQPVVVTERGGDLVCANAAFVERFGPHPPPVLPTLDGDASRALTEAARLAWRDGRAEAEGLDSDGGRIDALVTRAGSSEEHLVWRLRPTGEGGETEVARRVVEGRGGELLGDAGVMALLVGPGGRLTSGNRLFAQRALGRPDATVAGRDLVQLVAQPEPDGPARLTREASGAPPLRAVQLPLGERGAPDERATLLLLLDEEGGVAGAGQAAAGNLDSLLAMLPLGLALVDRDGRFLFQNDAFLRAAGRTAADMPVYPGDLVVPEDKAAVADAVRRFALAERGPTRTPHGRVAAPMSGDLAVRLAGRADEPVALTVARAQGLGAAAVLLGLKDNSEESRFKRQAEQATKMQAVGQLAGGVAHDFNNILTAILGHCDLVLLRHTPGDSDYDDIQQIRHNANRAAGLTRQLLAFSRQQTLRPQILQLPDVVSETSNLLKRLLGDRMQLVIKHGRALGPVRADPGQLEQVIVNLAVNARDAMPDGGTLTLQTYAISAGEVRRLGSDILPAADYTALSVTDTGTGIPPEVLPKIFEPFYTTKEIGKGTGLGLSTVYGIVKQSGGFIFADSNVGEGTSFVVYLPVHRGDPFGEEAANARPAEPARAAKKAPRAETWGSGHILVVEDEDMVRAVAERALVRQGYTVRTAASGEEALELLEGVERGDVEAFDLLVSDVVMPGMDGPALVRAARKRFPALRVLFMSGYAEEQLRKSIDIPNVEFLPKPFSVRKLAEATRAALGVD